MKVPKILIIWAIIIIPIHLYLVSQMENLSYNGFGVDIYGNLYIGEYQYIKVLSPRGEELRQISSETSRGYEFCIVNGETIYINLGDYFFIKNLDGETIEKIVVTDQNREQIPHITRRKCVLPDGTTYIWRSPWFRMTIYRMNGQEKVPVFQSPMSNYRVVLLAVFYFLGNAVMIPLIIRQWKKLNPSTAKRRPSPSPIYSPPQGRYSAVGQRKTASYEDKLEHQKPVPVCTPATRQESETDIDSLGNKEKWKSIPKWFWPAAIVFFVGCIILARLAVKSKEYIIVFIAWSIIYCTVVTIALWRGKKK